MGERFNEAAKMKSVALNISLISGAVGGNVVVAPIKDKSLGILQLRSAQVER
jgi:hypothetical protein